MKKQIIQNIKVIILALILVSGISYVFAGSWTQPPADPPNGNVDAPINVGSSTQWKSGVFGISFATTTGIAFAVPSGYSTFKGIVADVSGIISAGKITANGDLEVNGSVKIHDGGAVIGQTLTSKNAAGDTDWTGTSFGGMFTRNLDANGNYKDCRYSNPLTDDCSCPHGFTRYRVWEFKNVNGQFYRDEGNNIGWVDMYQCMAFPSPSNNRNLNYGTWDMQYYP